MSFNKAKNLADTVPGRRSSRSSDDSARVDHSCPATGNALSRSVGLLACFLFIMSRIGTGSLLSLICHPCAMSVCDSSVCGKGFYFNAVEYLPVWQAESRDFRSAVPPRPCQARGRVDTKT